MKNELFIFALKVFTGFFAIMNPFANLPVFLGLVEDGDKSFVRTIARKGTLVAFIILVIFVLFGKLIFDLFQLTIPAFKMTGGILLFQAGVEMLQSKSPSIQSQKSPIIDQGIAISPLAIPILAGPGTIVTAMNFTAGVDYFHISIILVVIGAMTLLTYLVFIGSEKVVKVLGRNIIEVIGKIMGLILAIMGMDMLVEGITLAFNLS